MSAKDDRLEILIGRLLDGDLSPSQQQALECELERDGEAKGLLGQLRALHECSAEVLAEEVRDHGADPEVIFERAWQQNKRSFWRRIAGADGHLRFAVGLAAGFLLGVGLHFALVQDARPATGLVTESPVARETPGRAGSQERTIPVVQPGPSMQVIRTVDWYGFTDATGNQWLIEGIQEGVARPVAYRGDLY